MLKVIKNGGGRESFKQEKLKDSIMKTLLASGIEWDFELVDDIFSLAEHHLEEQSQNGEIESTVIRDTLLYIFNSHPRKLRKAANAYKKYEKEKDRQQEMQAIIDILSNDATDEKTENGNINGFAYMGKMLHIGEEINKVHAKEFLMKPEHVKAHNEGFFYAHDLGFYSLGLSNCLSIDAKPLLEHGFYAGHGFLRSPSNINTAMMQAAIIMQSSQNNFFGLK